MKFREKTILTDIYRWFYRMGIHDNMPQSLCPYFWKMLWALIWAVPKMIFNIPAMFIVGRGYFWVNNKWEREDENVKSIGCWVGLFVIICMAMATSIFVNGMPHEDGSWYPFVMIGLVFWAIAFIAGMAWSGHYFNQRLKYKLQDERDSGHTPAIDVAKALVTSSYNKFCPRIEWIQKKD